MILFPSGIVSELVCHGPSGTPPVGCSTSRPLTSLVLTGQARLRERIREIAVGRGGVCRAPTTVAAAWRALAAADLLVFIDVARPIEGRVDEARAIAETLALRHGVLLAICGAPASAGEGPGGGDDEECWARQTGAFVYLPGVGGDAGIARIIDEARLVFLGHEAGQPAKIARS